MSMRRSNTKDEEDEDTFEEEEASEKKQKGKARSSSSSSGVCQVERCTADISIGKQYHKRHKVCEFHAKSPVVQISGRHQRFCQQCSRFTSSCIASLESSPPVICKEMIKSQKVLLHLSVYRSERQDG